jgi:hypothetical protein
MTEVVYRLVVIAFGYGLALLAGGATLAVAAPHMSLFTLPSIATSVDIMVRVMTLVGLVLDAPVVTIAALGLVAVVLGEIARLRGWAYHVLAWGAAGAAAAGASRWLWQSDASAGIARDVAIAFTASGFVAGFVYWLVAGRSA